MRSINVEAFLCVLVVVLCAIIIHDRSKLSKQLNINDGLSKLNAVEQVINVIYEKHDNNCFAIDTSHGVNFTSVDMKNCELK